MSTAISAEPLTALDATAAERRWLLPVYPHAPIEPVRGEGALLWTRDGRRLIDFYGGHAVALLGYGHPRLLAALAEQAEDAVLPEQRRCRSRPAPAPPSGSCEFGPEGLTKAFLVNSGAEANENALRLAFRRTGRRRVVAVEGAFHGRTAAAAAVTWGAERWYGFPRTPFEVTFVPRGDLDALEAALVAGGAAALIVEPVQGQAGRLDLGAGWLTRRARADATGRRPADLRRGAVRHGPHGPAVRGAGLRRHARPAHHRQGARRRLPRGRAAGLR